MNLEVARSELKYFISEPQSLILAERMKHVLTQDHHLEKRGYFVRSLYFDSHDDECLYEKESGVIFRKKYRLRIYDHNAEEVKFEIKHKLNSQIFKETATISKASAQKIIGGDYAEFLKYKNPILNKAYLTFISKLYRPKVVIDYFREAYKWGFFNIRITIDRDLRFSKNDYDIFSPTLANIPAALKKGKEILEIKYDKILPEHIRSLLQIDNFQRSAISKYALGRQTFDT